MNKKLVKTLIDSGLEIWLSNHLSLYKYKGEYTFCDHHSRDTYRGGHLMNVLKNLRK